MFQKFITGVLSLLFPLSGINGETPSIIVMVRPTYFDYNSQTAQTNYFVSSSYKEGASVLANREFDNAVAMLKEKGMDVLVLESPENAPDAVFPNNWFSFHLGRGGKENVLVLYPMLTRNRAIERNNTSSLVRALKSRGIEISEIQDFSHYESQSLALEGTGSLVFDPGSDFAFMARSKRSDEQIGREVCAQLNKSLIAFDSIDTTGNPIYHTNVMLSVGKEYAVICGESIKDGRQKERVYQTLQSSKRNFIEISQHQVQNMCGNIIEAVSQSGKKYIIMSERAYNHFTEKQLTSLREAGQPLVLPVNTIESIGGGSARCMVAVSYEL